MTLESPDLKIPSEVINKWQRIVDLLASIVQVPSAVVCQLETPHCDRYTIAASSRAEGNPFPLNDVFAMDLGTFCEEVIRSRKPLLVVNALEDAGWEQAPELRVGMVSYLGFPVIWPDGRMFGTICVLDDKANGYSELYQELLLHFRDVLQADLQSLVQLADELEDQRAHLGELFARVPEAVVMIDNDFRIRRINPEFTRIFGYAEDEAVGREIRTLVTPDDLQEEAEALLARLFEAEEAFAVETVRKRKDGARVPVSLICVPVQTRGADKAGYVIYRDLSDMKRLEHEQRRYQVIQLELAHASRIATLGQLSASIAHELNQPLTGIITNCGACQRMLTNDLMDIEGARAALRRTLRDGNRASEVIVRLRALFSNKPPTFEPVDLNEAAREVIALSLGELQSRRVILRTEFADDLPRVPADRVQLQQVVLNLVRNALDAMKTVEDHPRALLIRSERDDDNSVRLSVTDAGVGFDPRIMDRLFDAFFSTKTDGMGVGLSVSRSIIETHNGRLWATLNDGPGATFAFSVPDRPLSLDEATRH